MGNSFFMLQGILLKDNFKIMYIKKGLPICLTKNIKKISKTSQKNVFAKNSTENSL